MKTCDKTITRQTDDMWILQPKSGIYFTCVYFKDGKFDHMTIHSVSKYKNSVTFAFEDAYYTESSKLNRYAKVLGDFKSCVSRFYENYLSMHQMVSDLGGVK